MTTKTSTSQTPTTLDQALDGLRFAMVGTADPLTHEWSSRPLTLAEQDGPVLRFLTTTEAEWVSHLDGDHSPTGVTFSDPGKNAYVALQGRATVVNDRSAIERLWNLGASAFLDDKDDPTVRVLEVLVERGEYWDGPSGRIGSLLSIAKAALGRDAGSEGPIVLS